MRKYGDHDVLVYHLLVTTCRNRDASPAVSSGRLLLAPYPYHNIISLLLLPKRHRYRIAAHNEPPDSQIAPVDAADADADANTIVTPNQIRRRIGLGHHGTRPATYSTLVSQRHGSYDS